jgi:hypothetical protein
MIGRIQWASHYLHIASGIKVKNSIRLSTTRGGVCDRVEHMGKSTGTTQFADYCHHFDFFEILYLLQLFGQIRRRLAHTYVGGSGHNGWYNALDHRSILCGDAGMLCNYPILAFLPD